MIEKTLHIIKTQMVTSFHAPVPLFGGEQIKKSFKVELGTLFGLNLDVANVDKKYLDKLKKKFCYWSTTKLSQL